ncbi:DUF1049 domain-containing protein [Clostridia bacterium]|nr:DUF1049 domain-containing protein [Clostridia bacterium]
MFFWIFGLILSLVVALFASQNPLDISLKLFNLSFVPISLTVIILAAALAGALISFFFMGVRVISMKRELKKANKLLEKASALEASRQEKLQSVEKDSVAEVENAKRNLEVKEVENIELKRRLEQLEKEVDKLAPEKNSIQDELSEE